MDYKTKLLDPRWQKVRLKVFERDNWTCHDCESKTKTLHVHHREYLPNTEPWDTPLELLITKCYDCHNEEHNETTPILKEINELLIERVNAWNLIEALRDLGFAISPEALDLYNNKTNKIHELMAELKNV